MIGEPTGNRTRNRDFADRVPRQRTGSNGAMEEARTPVASVAGSHTTTVLPSQIDEQASPWAGQVIKLVTHELRLIGGTPGSCTPISTLQG